MKYLKYGMICLLFVLSGCGSDVKEFLVDDKDSLSVLTVSEKDSITKEMIVDYRLDDHVNKINALKMEEGKEIDSLKITKDPTYIAFDKEEAIFTTNDQDSMLRFLKIEELKVLSENVKNEIGPVKENTYKNIKIPTKLPFDKIDNIAMHTRETEEDNFAFQYKFKNGTYMYVGIVFNGSEDNKPDRERVKLADGVEAQYKESDSSRHLYWLDPDTKTYYSLSFMNGKAASLTKEDVIELANGLK